MFDSHAHYDDKKFDDDRETLLASLPEAGICGIINCGVDLKSSRASLKLAEKYSFIRAACGIHAHEAAEAEDGDIEKIAKLAEHEKCVAIGEIGLDYHYDFSPFGVQIRIFEEQLILANEMSLPVIIHDREAHEDTLVLLKKYRPQGVMHCFSGSVEMAKEIVALGMYIGIGGAVTFKNAKKPASVAEYVPDDRLLIETDAPYMTPEPFRGKRCDSSLIPYTAQKLAELRNTDPKTILDITCKNARQLFTFDIFQTRPKQSRG